VEAASDGFNKGSEFLVRLPLLANGVDADEPATAGRGIAS
jgi:hypothetical protein